MAERERTILFTDPWRDGLSDSLLELTWDDRLQERSVKVWTERIWFALLSARLLENCLSCYLSIYLSGSLTSISC